MDEFPYEPGELAQPGTYGPEVLDVDAELEQLTAAPVCCRRCGTPHPLHGDAGGPVTVRAGAWAGSPGLPLRCIGFQWVDPVSDSPTYGSYS